MALVPADFSAASYSFLNSAQEISGERTDQLMIQFRRVRAFSRELCEPLAVEDYVVQSMADASPIKWHLLHTSWFFETFVLKQADHSYQPFNPQFESLFNSYYNAVGPQFPRPKRGVLSRPTVAETQDYRRHVDKHMLRLLEHMPPHLEDVVELGIQHEQQHQELMLTDLKHAFSFNPLFPVYREGRTARSALAPALHWHEREEGVHEIGHTGRGFAFDNELPRHRQYLERFQLATRLVTNREYMKFIRAKGYKTPSLWLSEGWNSVCSQGWQAPLYWQEREGSWWQFTLSGLREVDPDEPVCHVSFFEADAFARWAGARLPTEAEWEIVASEQRLRGNFVESRRFHPAAPPEDPSSDMVQLYGDVWEWTASAYLSYPGYEPAEGALGEYNGKFMCNQMVLRGGSCATSITHIRKTYRNFFPPAARWQFTGLRLARDC